MLKMATLKRGFHKGIMTALDMGKILVPIYILVSLLKETPVIPVISGALTPLMGLFGLPGEASIAIVLGNVINMYGALGAMASLDLTAKQITIIAVMLSFSHSLIVESTIMKKVGVSVLMIIVIRVGLSVTSGIILNWIL
jgi:hypothetical protein